MGKRILRFILSSCSRFFREISSAVAIPATLASVPACRSGTEPSKVPLAINNPFVLTPSAATRPLAITTLARPSSNGPMSSVTPLHPPHNNPTRLSADGRGRSTVPTSRPSLLRVWTTTSPSSPTMSSTGSASLAVEAGARLLELLPRPLAPLQPRPRAFLSPLRLRVVQ